MDGEILTATAGDGDWYCVHIGYGDGCDYGNGTAGDGYGNGRSSYGYGCNDGDGSGRGSYGYGIGDGRMELICPPNS